LFNLVHFDKRSCRSLAPYALPTITFDEISPGSISPARHILHGFSIESGSSWFLRVPDGGGDRGGSTENPNHGFNPADRTAAATPTAEVNPQLTKNKETEQETKPLIPSVQSPSPSPSPKPLPAEIAKQLDDQFQEALKLHRLRPKNLLSLSLVDAVRLALAQNSDIRLAGEDVQSARRALKQATGEYDRFAQSPGQLSTNERALQRATRSVPEIHGFSSTPPAQTGRLLRRHPHANIAIFSSHKDAKSQSFRFFFVAL
jgi:hypothetical protein